MEDEIHEAQAGFRTGRGTRDHIFNMRMIIEKCREYNIELHACFIDYTKAFDCVNHHQLWEIMNDMGFPKHITRLIAELYKDQEAAVKVEGARSEWFNVQKGVRQGCTLSPYLFNIYAENIMRNVRQETMKPDFRPINIGGLQIPEIRYADDSAINNKQTRPTEHN